MENVIKTEYDHRKKTNKKTNQTNEYKNSRPLMWLDVSGSLFRCLYSFDISCVVGVEAMWNIGENGLKRGNRLFYL